VRDNLHAKRSGADRDLLTDASEADDAERLPAELDARGGGGMAERVVYLAGIRGIDARSVREQFERFGSIEIFIQEEITMKAVYRNVARILLCAGLLLASGVVGFAQEPSTHQASPPADNTKVNTRDRSEGAVTADQQKENATDRTLTQKVRQSLIRDKSLSTYAHNVKIISQGGEVTLKGPVRSDEEKQIVEAKAAEVAGTGHVRNELTIAPAKTQQ
jgi:osmotically-inducible protein OsmY